MIRLIAPLWASCTQSTAVYERLTLEPVRQSVQNATEALFAAAEQNEDAIQVVELLTPHPSE